MKKIFIFLILGLFLISFISASIGNLEPVKQNTDVELIQTCSDCTYNNITYIQKPDGTILNFNVAMERDDTFYNWTLDSNYTDLLGEYTVNGFGDIGGTKTTWNYKFPVTPSGFLNTLGFYVVLLSFVGLVILLGFAIKEVWFVVLGGMGLIMLGLYSINSGIVGFRDMFMTWGVGLFQIAVGTILAIGAASQKLDFD